MVLNEEQWIKELREKRIAYGISQGRLAVASGITREYLNKIESGKMKPSKELLNTLHKELARFNPEAPLTMLFDYVKIRFPTLDIQHIIKDILKLNINYMLHEDYGRYSYTEHYSLDPIFIYVLDLGVAGAAIATAISQVVSTLVYLFYIFGKKSVFDFKIKNYCLSKEVASEIFKIGIPTLVFQILTSLSISLINNAAADYGDAAIAGMGVVTRLVSMGSLTIFGFIKGFQPIAGYSYGAKKFNRLHEAIKTSVIWSTVFCVVYGLILALFSTSIVSQFASGNLEMIKVGASSLRVNGISLMLFGFYTVYSSLFLALGKGKEGFILGACRQGICFVPVILVLPMIWGLNGILYAQPVADVLSAIITVFMAIHLHRELNEAEKQAAIAGTNEVH